MAYTGLWDASASKFKHHNATPAPKPCSKTIGTFGDSSFNEMVHILSAGPTTGPISTNHPRYAVFKPNILIKCINVNFDLDLNLVIFVFYYLSHMTESSSQQHVT